jgi:hypothetical protein
LYNLFRRLSKVIMAVSPPACAFSLPVAQAFFEHYAPLLALNGHGG